MESKNPDETLKLNGMNLNLCILRIFEVTISDGIISKQVYDQKSNFDFGTVCFRCLQVLYSIAYIFIKI